MNTKRHRHFVAVPVAVIAMLVMAGTHSLMPVSAEDTAVPDGVVLTADADRPFRIGHAVSGILRYGALRAQDEGAMIEFVRGQALLSPSGYTVTAAGDIVIHSLGAPFEIVRDAGITVAALRDPVVILHGEHRTVLLAGRQVSLGSDGSATESPVPAEWHAGRMAELRTLPASPDDGRMTAAMYEALRTAVGTGTEEMRLLLIRLALRGARTDADAARMITDDFLADDILKDEFTRLLPSLAMTSAKPVQPELIRAWAGEVIRQGLKDGTGSALLIRDAAVLPAALTQAGYPLQAREWKSSLGRAAAVLKTTVSAPNRAVLAGAEQLFLTSAGPVADAPDDAPAEKPAPATSWTADELSAITRDTLVSHGALIATSTAFTADAETQTVLVQGVFVAENGKDVPYTFTYDPAASVLRQIRRDGRLLPNAVPVQTFFR